MADTYTVTGQRQTTIINDAGNVQSVMEVTFRTSTGVTAKIDVPIGQYNKATVQEMIENYVNNINDVHNL